MKLSHFELNCLVKSFLKDKKALAGLITALALPLVIGFVGFGVDAGLMYSHREALQNAVDAGAISGAYQLTYSSATPSSSQLAIDQAVTRAVTQDADGTVVYPVTVNTTSSTVKVTANARAPLYFFGALGFSPFTITASATAGFSNTNTCVLALSKTASPGINVSGHGNVNSPNCGILSDSAAPQSIYTSGSSIITTTSLDAVGGISASGTVKGPIHENLADGGLPNPLAGLTASAGGVNQTVPSTPIIALAPGNYAGGLNISANTTVSFAPGTYYIDGNFNMNGNVTITSATGVTFVVNGEIAWSGNTSSNVVMSAATTGPYAGVLLYQLPTAPTSNKGNIIQGNSNIVTSGTMYFPNDSFTIDGNATSGPTNVAASAGAGVNIIAQTINVTGNATLNIGNPTALNGHPSQVVLLN